MRHKIHLTILILFIFMYGATNCNASWLIYHKPELKGKIIDSETKEPIKGAVVVAIYRKSTIGGPGGRISSIINIKEQLTDEKGKFMFPSYTTIIQPLSNEDMVNFIIFKPGYGSFPKSHKTPSGIKPKDQETYFSKETGSMGELDMWVKTDKHPDLVRFKVAFGIIELPELKTWNERRKAMMITVGGDIPKSKWPILNGLRKKEDEWLYQNRGWRK